MSKKYKTQVITSYIFKISSIGLNLLQISLLNNTLNKLDFSIWVTVISFTNWLLFFEIGIGNSLRSKVSFLFHSNKNLISKYVSNAYLLTIIVFLTLTLINYLAFHLVDWNNFLNTNYSPLKTLALSIFIAIFAVSLNQFFSLVSQLLHSIQKTGISAIHSVLWNLIFCLLLIIFKTELNGILLISKAYLFSIFLSGIIITIAFFSKNKLFRPSYKNSNFEIVKELINTGSILILVEMAPLVLNFFNNIFISKYLNINLVGDFSIIFRIYFAIATTSWILIVPFWSFVSEHLVLHDFNSINAQLIKLKKYLIPILLFLIVIGFLCEIIIKIWIGKEIVISTYLILYMSSYVALSYWNTLHIFLLNGLNKQIFNLIYSASVFLLIWPLSYYFSIYLSLGVEGVMLGTICSMVPYAIITHHYKKYIFSKKDI